MGLNSPFWSRISIICLFLTILSLPDIAYSTVIAAGKLESCVRDGSTEELELECEERLIVTVAVENGRLLDTEQLEVDMRCLNSVDGKCPCRYLYQTLGERRT